MVIKLPLLLASLFLVIASAFCQDPIGDSYDYKYVTFPDGSYLSCRENLYLDSSGFLWTATQTGLILYDGLNLINFPANNDSDSIRFSDIQLFNSTSDEKLIIVSSDNTISLFDTQIKEIVAQARPANSHLQSIGQTYSNERTGTIFLEDHIVPDDNGGYYIIFKSDETAIYKAFYSSDGTNLKFIRSFDIGRIASIVFSENELFLSTRDGIIRLDKALNILKRDSVDLTQQGIAPFLMKDSESNIYIYENCLSSDCKILKYNRSKNTYDIIGLPADLDLKEIHKIKIENGIFWLFGVNKLIYYNPEDQTHSNIFSSISESFDHFESPPLISHYTSIKSNDNVSWLSSGYGLVQLDARRKSYSIFLRSDPEFCNGFCSMRGIDEDSNGNLWLASYSGLIKKTSDGKYSKIEALSSQLDNGIYSLEVNKLNVLVNDILYNIETNQYHIIIPEKQNGHVTNVVISEDQYLLSSCYNNGNQIYLYHYNNITKKRKNISLPPSIQNQGQITDMILSKSKKEVFLSTSNGGSFVLDLSNYEFRSIIPDEFWHDNKDTHYCIFETDEYIYIGSSKGLVELDIESNDIQQHTLAIFASNQIIQERNFFSILEENDSTLWFGTNSGILSFNSRSKLFTAHTQLGKLGKEEFNRQSSYKMNNGQLLFGSVNGVYGVLPNILRDFKNIDNQTLNLISIEHFDGQTQRINTDFTLGEEEKITFQHNDKMINFKISMPDFRTQQTVYYSYFLKGFHVEWSRASTENEINFTYLDPGDYILQIKAGHDAQLQDVKELSIPIEITEPWYVSLWFRSFMIFSSLALVYIIFKVRYLQLLKYEQLKSDISKDLHDDVGTILTGIAMQSELMAKFADDNIKELASSIALRSREAMSSMRDTVWAIDSRKDSTLDLKERILDYVLDTLYPKDISYSLDSNIKNSETKIMPHIRQAVYLIAKESINNIVKHSDTAKVDIKLHVNKKVLSLNIKDYGSFQTIRKTGQGLMNMKNRAQKINGEYIFTYDNGFSTSVKIPLK